MKKTVIRVVSLALCLITALLSLMACGKMVAKQEIPNNVVYEFAGVQNLTVKNSEELKDETDTLTRSYIEQHYVHYWDENKNMTEKIDSLLCKDGKITFTHYYGKGNASFINGGRIYGGCETKQHTLGTYSGKDVTLDTAAEANEYYTDAYLTEEGFIICVEEEDSEGVIIKYELIFKKIA